MIVLVLNCGSSSLKFQLYDMVQGKPLAKGLVERIGMENGRLKFNVNDEQDYVVENNFPDHNVAIKAVLESLTEKGAIESLSEIDGIGHRVVHGGEKFASSVVIDEQVLNYITECVELAPLHNPPIILGIKACQELMPNIKQVAVFDTAFHQTIPPHGYLYGLPYELYEKHGIRRYGFHGTSHKYVALRAAKMLNKPLEELKIITCHLGNGSSITAVKNGKSIETSMGLTPLAGLIMGTRSGDIDPGIIPLVMEKENLNTEEVKDFLNKKCGVLGISGVSSDFRDIEVAAGEGNQRAQIALDLFSNGIKKYIGSYAAIMGGVDAIVFTAGVGENSPETRVEATTDLEFLGIEMDIEKNKVRGKEVEVSKEGSKVKILVIPTNEELMIAKETEELIK